MRMGIDPIEQQTVCWGMPCSTSWISALPIKIGPFHMMIQIYPLIMTEGPNSPIIHDQNVRLRCQSDEWYCWERRKDQSSFLFLNISLAGVHYIQNQSERMASPFIRMPQNLSLSMGSTIRLGTRLIKWSAYMWALLFFVILCANIRGWKAHVKTHKREQN